MHLKHMLTALFVAFMWGAHYTVVKVGLNDIPPFFLNFLRYSFASLPLLCCVKRPPGISWPMLISLSLVMSVLSVSFVVLGVHCGVSSGIASILVQSHVVFTLILSKVFLRAPLNRFQVGGVFIAITGVMCIGMENYAGDHTSSYWGVFFLLSGAFAWAIANVAFRRLQTPQPFALVVWMSIIPPIPFLILSFTCEGLDAMRQSVLAMNLRSAGALSFLVIASTWLATPLWMSLLKRYDPSVVAPYSLMVPVFGMSVSTLVLGETYTSLSLTGCAFIFFGLVLSQWHQLRCVAKT